MIDFQIVGLEAWDSVATRSEHTNLKQITRYKLRGSWWFAVLTYDLRDVLYYWNRRNNSSWKPCPQTCIFHFFCWKHQTCSNNTNLYLIPGPKHACIMLTCTFHCRILLCIITWYQFQTSGGGCKKYRLDQVRGFEWKKTCSHIIGWPVCKVHVCFPEFGPGLLR